MLRLTVLFCLSMVVFGGNVRNGLYRLVSVDPSTKSQGSYGGSSPTQFGGGQPPVPPPMFAKGSSRPSRPYSPFSQQQESGPMSPISQQMQSGSGSPFPEQTTGPVSPFPIQQEMGPVSPFSQQAQSNSKRPHSKPKEEETPKPYKFMYVAEGEDGSSSRTEESDASGKVTGSYSIMESDGRVRTVEYVADSEGFRAKVTTNEQGTESKSPANVDLQSNAPAVDYTQYTKPASQPSSGYGQGGPGYEQGSSGKGGSQNGNGQVKKYLLVPVDASEAGQKSIGPSAQAPLPYGWE